MVAREGAVELTKLQCWYCTVEIVFGVTRLLVVAPCHYLYRWREFWRGFLWLQYEKEHRVCFRYESFFALYKDIRKRTDCK